MESSRLQAHAGMERYFLQKEKDLVRTVRDTDITRADFFIDSMTCILPPPVILLSSSSESGYSHPSKEYCFLTSASHDATDLKNINNKDNTNKERKTTALQVL